MPQKTKKNIATTDKKLENSDNKKTKEEKAINSKLSSVQKGKEQKKESEKKVVVKRRKKDLTPSKASATAIISQANRAKKQALIKKMAETQTQVTTKVEQRTPSSKVPLWVRILFGCSLFLFCISFYHAIIRPQLETEIENVQEEGTIYRSSDDENDKLIGGVDLSSINDENDIFANNNGVDKGNIIANPKNAEELIESYFAYMSAGMFDESFALFDKKTQNDKNIKDYFTASSMSPFFEGIEGNSITPKNIQKTSETYRGKDVYTFDISYMLSSTHEQYDETRKFAVNENDGDLKILMMYCVSNGCGRHPIFGP